MKRILRLVRLVTTAMAAAIVLFPALALAAPASTPAPGSDLRVVLESAAVQYLVVPVFAAVGTALVAALGALTAWALGKRKEVGANRLAMVGFTTLNAAAQVIRAAVARVQVELRPQLEQATADGRLGPEEKRELKTRAMELAREALGAEGLRQLQELLGVTLAGVTTWISGQVEEAVATSPVVRGAAPQPSPAAGVAAAVAAVSDPR